jgi:DNA-binding CsgD family transcriptional regulator
VTCASEAPSIRSPLQSWLGGMPAWTAAATNARLSGLGSVAHRRGALALAERAHTELVASGARPRRVLLSGVDALTPSERRVADMAAAGRTNREIAQALFVTARTVEGHLTHVFQKLGIESRAELPRALAG